MEIHNSLEADQLFNEDGTTLTTRIIVMVPLLEKITQAIL